MGTNFSKVVALNFINIKRAINIFGNPMGGHYLRRNLFKGVCNINGAHFLPEVVNFDNEK